MEPVLLIIILIPVFLCLVLILARREAGIAREQELSSVIDRLLPQTQCGQCGYPGCMPYADAIASGGAPINLCPPGGEQTIRYLAELLGRNFKPLAPQLTPETQNRVALIDEELCIGCVKCIKVCPVDAIIGARGVMHTVMPKPCTGCGLCVEPCPVDCITIVPASTRIKKWVWTRPQPVYEARW